MKKENNKIKIARLKERLNKTFDNTERAIILADIEKLENAEKSINTMRANAKSKITSVAEAPVIMDRPTKESLSYNGHNRKAVNGVYQKEITSVRF